MRATDRFLHRRPQTLRLFLGSVGFCYCHFAPFLWLACSAVIIMKTLDVVFAKIISSLHFDKRQPFLTGILDPMSCADRNVDRLARPNRDLLAVECYFCSSFHPDPVFGAL